MVSTLKPRAYSKNITHILIPLSPYIQNSYFLVVKALPFNPTVLM